jgi:hypothetical protein
MSVKTKMYVTQKMYDDVEEDVQKEVRIVPEHAFEADEGNALLMVPTFNRKQRRTLLRAMRLAEGKKKVRAIKDRVKAENKKKRRKK